MSISAAVGSCADEWVHLASQISQEGYVAQYAPNFLGPADGATSLEIHIPSLGFVLQKPHPPTR
jgi:hypothetical protein